VTSTSALLSSSSVTSVDTCQAHLKSLEDLISGGKTRLLAYLSLSTLPSATTTTSPSSSTSESSFPHTSMIRYPNQWISLTSGTSIGSGSKLKNKTLKMKKKGSAPPASSGGTEETEKTLLLQPIPPLFEPIPCKPIFYDLASNYLDSTVNDVLDVRCGIKKTMKKSKGETSASPSPSSAAATTAVGGGLVGAAASWIGWFSGK
jgi:hypothetical protein